MKGLPAPTAKNINEAHQLARSTAESAVQHAIRCGQLLAEKKKALDHGDFTAWVEKHCDFSVRSARVYMKAAEQNGSALPFSSLRQLLAPPADQAPKPKREKPPETKAAPEPFAADPTPPRQPEPASTRATAEPEFIPARDADEPERPDIDEDEEDAALARAEERARDDRDRRIDAILESGDQLAEALAQLKQQSALIATLETTRDGYMRGKDAVTKLLKAEQGKVAKLEKKLRGAEAEIEKLRERIAIMEAA